MHHHTAAHLADLRRTELIAAAAYHRQLRAHRGRPERRPGARLRKPITTFNSWLAAGQL